MLEYFDSFVFLILHDFIEFTAKSMYLRQAQWSEVLIIPIVYQNL